jgi:hypothetical protein
MYIKVDSMGVMNLAPNDPYLELLLGSGDGGKYGVYNLSLGAMEKGTHKIELTIQDDGKGNGSFGWDALVLIAKKR